MEKSDQSGHLATFVDLYKFYWNLSIKICIFLVSVTGAVSAYVLKNQDVPLMFLALVLPIGMCFLAAWMAHINLEKLEFLGKEIQRLGKQLGWSSYVDVDSVVVFIGALRFIFLACGIGMLVLSFVVC